MQCNGMEFNALFQMDGCMGGWVGGSLDRVNKKLRKERNDVNFTPIIVIPQAKPSQTHYNITHSKSNQKFILFCC